MKAECKEIASILLSIDNSLAMGVSDLEHRDYGGIKYAAEAAEQAAKMAHVKGILNEGEASPFQTKTQILSYLSEDRLDAAMELMGTLHELAERLLLEKVIACECGKA